MILDFNDYKSELELAEFDELIQFIGNEIKEEESLPAVINSKRLKDMEITHRAICSVLKNNPRIKIECHYNEPFKETGYISIVANKIDIDNANMFRIAAKLTDNIEVYPLANGKIQMNLGFHRLTTRI